MLTDKDFEKLEQAITKCELRLETAHNNAQSQLDFAGRLAETLIGVEAKKTHNLADFRVRGDNISKSFDEVGNDIIKDMKAECASAYDELNEVVEELLHKILEEVGESEEA